MTNKNQTNRSQLLRHIQSLKYNNFTYIEVTSKSDTKKVMKELEGIIKKGDLSVILIKN